jgi:lipoic acid synthetase
VLVEALTGDFGGDRTQLAAVLAARPDVFAHNVETVERLTKAVRDGRCGYTQSIEVLRAAKQLAPDATLSLFTQIWRRLLVTLLAYSCIRNKLLVFLKLLRHISRKQPGKKNHTPKSNVKLPVAVLVRRFQKYWHPALMIYVAA